MKMTGHTKTWLKRGLLVLAGVVVASVAVWYFVRPEPAENIAKGNGRIEATEVDAASKIPGRIKEILVNEGDFVDAGQVVARIDTENLEAQLRQAQAELQRSQTAVATSQSRLAQRTSELAATRALVVQREAELQASDKRRGRSNVLSKEGATSQQEAEDDEARVQSARAAVLSQRAQVAAAQAAVVTAQSQVQSAEADVVASRATTERIQADINDSTLKSPRAGRVQYRVAQPGEVVAAGGRVLNLVDLSDVYMTFFLPTGQAGRVSMGSEVRLVLDALPQVVIPANVSFVADVAQFTPKTVETAKEREKLMFRVKARIAPELLREHLTRVKTGLPGMAYVRLNSQAQWPEKLAVTGRQ
jgi:HlyD family secretion protein